MGVRMRAMREAQIGNGPNVERRSAVRRGCVLATTERSWVAARAAKREGKKVETGLAATLYLEFLGVTVIVCWADARVYPLANLSGIWVAQITVDSLLWTPWEALNCVTPHPRRGPRLHYSLALTDVAHDISSHPLHLKRTITLVVWCANIRSLLGDWALHRLWAAPRHSGCGRRSDHAALMSCGSLDQLV